jgi:hypothetical protein
MILANPLRLDERSDLKHIIQSQNMIYWFCILCQEIDNEEKK